MCMLEIHAKHISSNAACFWSPIFKRCLAKESPAGFLDHPAGSHPRSTSRDLEAPEWCPKQLTIWLWLTVRHGKSLLNRGFQLGKSSRNLGNLYHGYVSHNQRLNIQWLGGSCPTESCNIHIHSWKDQANIPFSHLIYPGMMNNIYLLVSWFWNFIPKNIPISPCFLSHEFLMTILPPTHGLFHVGWIGELHPPH